MAYTRLGLLGATASPTLPRPGMTSVPAIKFQVAPPSVDLYTPLPGPFDGGYTLHGGRRVCQRAAKTVCVSGEAARSIAPVSLSLNKTLFQVWPPSVVRKTPRSGFGP